MRALAEMNRQKYSDAQQDLTKAMAWLREARRPSCKWATCIQLQKQYLEAIKFYRQALDKDAASTDALQGS